MVVLVPLVHSSLVLIRLNCLFTDTLKTVNFMLSLLKHRPMLTLLQVIFH